MNNVTKLPTSGHVPTSIELRTYRAALGLSQSTAAAVIHVTTRTWAGWEADERKMSAGLWELFLMKTQPCRVVESLIDAASNVLMDAMKASGVNGSTLVPTVRIKDLQAALKQARTTTKAQGLAIVGEPA